jgi:ABC-type polysaccharide/polyol phosphate transport system ATPase subunit
MDTTTPAAEDRRPAAAAPPGNAIEVRHLTKEFRVFHKGAGSIKRAILGVMRRQRVEQFTALKDVSFSVPHGQTLAVIGRNGSGKSTLLSLLARVYRPTSGEVLLYSLRPGERVRIAPLLELGAGFHPDLDGLENAEFYGALLGMTAREIDERLDDIIAFAELKGKMDTPMRNWNNGAKLRLGFAIAVHTDPDILLVDEVLAVGDEAFQQKCRQKITELQEQGKTIIFVSHDLRTVERVANRVLWLNMGVLEMDGDTATVLAKYREAAAAGR